MIATDNDPLVSIFDASLHTENYTLSNNAYYATGFLRTSSFWVKYYSANQRKKGPTWEQILLQCPDMWVKEGIGLWANDSTFRPIDSDKLIGGKNVEMEVIVYYNPPLISKRGLSRLSAKQLRALYDKGKDFWEEPQQRPNAWLLIEREYYRRSDPWSIEYLKYLDPKTVYAKLRKFESDNVKHTNKEVYLAAIRKLYKNMLADGKAYWKYQYID